MTGSALLAHYIKSLSITDLFDFLHVKSIKCVQNKKKIDSLLLRNKSDILLRC